MTRNRIGIAIIGVLLTVFSISSCTYRSAYHPGYDNGYRGGYGYRYAPPPRVVVVRPTPPPRPRVVYRNNRRSYHSDRRSNRNFNRQSHKQYGHNGRSHNRR